MAKPYEEMHLLPIAGQWREGSGKQDLTVKDPYQDQELLKIRQANREDMDAAYARANEVQPDWAATSPAARAAILYRVVELFDVRKDEIIDWLVRESGSTKMKAEIEWASARGITLEAASMPSRVHGRTMASNVPGKEHLVYRKPLGVVSVISPWNFPLHLSQRSVVPALALGNTVVIKPASDTPVTGGLLIARLFEEAGLPAGALSVVVGPGRDIGDAFVEHPVPSLISFTGSTPVGRGIARIAGGGEHIKRVALELGGNGPFVVLDDADIEQAVAAAIVGTFLHQGQICMAVNRIIVDASRYDEFVERFVAKARALTVGDPAQASTAIGPIINQAQLEGLQEKIAKAKQEGAKVLLEGEVKGQVLPPHVFGDVTPEMNISREEIFGPLIGILKARNEAHALELANDTEYGLSSAVFSGDLARGLRFAQRIRAGMVHVNDMPVNDEPNAPFGGEKNSGLGRFSGDWAIAEFTTDQWVSVQHQPRKYPF